MKTSAHSSIHIHALRAAVVVCAVTLAACGGADGDPANPAAPPIVGIPSPTPPAGVAAPTITAQPAAASAMEGDSVTFSVAAAGGGTLLYQWLLDGVAVAGATSVTYTVVNATLAQSGGNYSVHVSNSGGSVTSQSVSLTVAAGAGMLQPRAQRLSASQSGYMLATRSDGSVVAWGTAMVGGTGTVLAGSTAKVVAGVSGGLAVAAHKERSLVVSANGNMFGWGRNAEGALGVQVTSYNQLVPTAVPIGQVASVAQAMTCDRATYVLKTDGTVWLVPGQRNSVGVVAATKVPGLSAITSLVVAEDSGISCDLLALDSTGRAWVSSARQSDWNAATQMRTWTATVTQDLVVPPSTKQLACSTVILDSNSGHCLALTADGKLWSWGKNHSGQLGLGDEVDRTIAVQFATSNNVKTLLAGGNYSYILTTEGAVYGWGGTGQGGPSNMLAGTNSTHVPVLLQLTSGVEELVMPGRFPQYMAAMKSDGSVWVWGSNVNGVFGNGTSGTNSAAPVQVVGVNLK